MRQAVFLRLKRCLHARISQSTITTDALMCLALKTVSVSHSSAQLLLFAKTVQILMLQVGSKNARGTNAEVILSANNLFATKDTVMSRGVETGEEEETMAFKLLSFSLSSLPSSLLSQSALLSSCAKNKRNLN